MKDWPVWSANAPRNTYKLKQNSRTGKWRVYNKTRKTFVGPDFDTRKLASAYRKTLKRG